VSLSEYCFACKHSWQKLLAFGLLMLFLAALQKEKDASDIAVSYIHSFKTS